MKQKYLILIEKAAGNYSAYLPDVPGCVTVGDTIEEVKKNMVEALTLHFNGLHTEGDPIPQPATEAAYVEFDWTPTKLEPSKEKDPLAGL